jgi:hypothetical protein
MLLQRADQWAVQGLRCATGVAAPPVRSCRTLAPALRGSTMAAHAGNGGSSESNGSSSTTTTTSGARPQAVSPFAGGASANPFGGAAATQRSGGAASSSSGGGGGGDGTLIPVVARPWSLHSWSWRGHKINYAVRGIAGRLPHKVGRCKLTPGLQQADSMRGSWSWKPHGPHAAPPTALHNPQTAGCGRPVVLVHGFGASLGHYRRTIPALAEAGYKVYAVDLLGFGASDKPVLQYTIELWAQLLADFTAEFAVAGGGGGGPRAAAAAAAAAATEGGSEGGGSGSGSGSGAVLVGNSIGSLVCLAVRPRRGSMSEFGGSKRSGLVLPVCSHCLHKTGPLNGSVRASCVALLIIQKPGQREAPTRSKERSTLSLCLHTQPLVLFGQAAAALPSKAVAGVCLLNSAGAM